MENSLSATCTLGHSAKKKLALSETHGRRSGRTVEECDYLIRNGIEVGPDALRISEKAHLIMPYHQAIDVAREQIKAIKKSNDRRGIDRPMKTRLSRKGYPLYRSVEEDVFRKKCMRSFLEKISTLKNSYRPELNADKLSMNTVNMHETVAPHVTDISVELNEALRTNKKVCLKAPKGPIWISTTAPTRS
jgi:adenylosuccinate synthase